MMCNCGESGRMYAENYIQCATERVNGANVCRKQHTMCNCKGERGKCMPKTTYNVQLKG